jgi:hypothetical protein
MKENIKIALLAVISVTLVAHTYFQYQQNTKIQRPTHSNMTSLPPGHSPDDGHNHDNPMSKVNEMVNTGPVTSMNFEQYAHNFGKIKQDTQNKHKFKFTNTGSNPLIIENATGSCGCTVPEYPREPIPPGGTGEITVEYSPGKQQGVQSKTVTITANTEPKQINLTINATVEEVPL